MALKCWQLAGSTDDPRAIESLRKLAEEYQVAAEAAETAEAIGAAHNEVQKPAAKG